jgi:uncharacterized caspase-like protein
LSRAFQPGTVALFYFAGHGVQIDGDNYLIPTDYNGKDESDVTYGSRSASWIQEKLDKTGAQLKMLILDACRDKASSNTAGSRYANIGNARHGQADRDSAESGSDRLDR